MSNPNFYQVLCAQCGRVDHGSVACDAVVEPVAVTISNAMSNPIVEALTRLADVLDMDSDFPGAWSARQSLIRAIPAVESLVAENARLRETFYLPMDCPTCGRARLLCSPATKSVECEKCFTSAWDCDEVLHEAGGPHPQRRAPSRETTE